MVKFQALMQAIHQSINSATQAVESQGQKHLDKFFDIVKGTENDADGRPDYKPKMIDMEFPSRTPNGVETMNVKVPLITLTPISSPRISEVKFTTELEITTDEQGDLLVAFPSSGKGKSFLGGDSGNSANTSIEIVLKGHEPPEGLQKIVEGYERALRAQIPG
jgi:hypothetical protein